MMRRRIGARTNFLALRKVVQRRFRCLPSGHLRCSRSTFSRQTLISLVAPLRLRRTKAPIGRST
jgi:hypothetical protein